VKGNNPYGYPVYLRDSINNLRQIMREYNNRERVHVIYIPNSQVRHYRQILLPCGIVTPFYQIGIEFWWRAADVERTLKIEGSEYLGIGVLHK
jgi:hypothetical protein